MSLGDMIKNVAPWAFALSLPIACSTAGDPEGSEEPIGQVSEALTSTISVSDDSYVRSGAAGTNYGSEAAMLADANDGGSELQTYVKFTMPTLSGITNVKLRLRCFNSTAGAYNVRSVANTSWTEGSLTWSNKPALGSTVTSFPSASSGTWVELDLTSVAASGATVSVAIVSAGTNDGVDFRSSEYSTAGERPQVVITTSDGTGGTGGSSGTTSTTTSTTGGTGGTGGSGGIGTVPTEANLKVAFVGDTADGTNWGSVLQLALAEGADVVVTAGDMTYDADPAGWWSRTETAVGQSYPVFLARGNHDDTSWSGFQAEANNHLGGATRTAGPHDAAYKTVFKGLALATIKLGDTSTTVNNLLAGDDHIWRICNWHQNQNKMQVGSKGDEMGWNVYETCRQQGAIIITGHEHSYERTKTLTDMDTQTIDSSCSSGSSLCVGPGRTFVTVTGLGGTGIRNQDRCAPTSTTPPYPSLNTSDPSCPIWASIYTTNQGANYGAQFIEFNVDGNPKKARGYFKTISGTRLDDFTVFHD